jgi:hypothetical protein
MTALTGSLRSWDCCRASVRARMHVSAQTRLPRTHTHTRAPHTHPLASLPCSQASNGKTWLGGSVAATLQTNNDPSATNFSRLSYSENFGKYRSTIDNGDLPSELVAPYAVFLSRSAGSATASMPNDLKSALAAASAMVSLIQPVAQTPAAAAKDNDNDADEGRIRARARREEAKARLAELQQELPPKKRKSPQVGRSILMKAACVCCGALHMVHS